MTELILVCLLGALSVLVIVRGWQQANAIDRERDTFFYLPAEIRAPDPYARARELAMQPGYFTEAEQEEIRELLVWLANESRLTTGDCMDAGGRTTPGAVVETTEDTGSHE